jgi:hypothetical protein
MLMARRLPQVLVLLLLFLSFPAASPAAQPASIMEDYRVLKTLYPRLEGSDAEAGAIAYISERLGNLNLSFQRINFSESDETHSFSSVVAVDIPGKLPDTLILAVPLNHPPGAEAQSEGSINIALALGLIEDLTRFKPTVSVKFLFLGAEYGEEPDYPRGSRLFLRDFYPEESVSLIYLNLRSIPSRLYIRAGGRGIASPFWLIDRSTNALRRADLFFLIRGNENQLFRFGLPSEETIIEPFLEAGYPALSFEGVYGPLSPGQEEEWVESFRTFFALFQESFARGIPEAWDQHYLFFQAREIYFKIAEQSYLAALIAVMAGLLAYGLSFSRRLKKYLKTLWRNLWNLPVFAGISFLLLLLSTLALEAVLAIRGMTRLWEELPLLFLAFKIIFPFFLFMLIFRYLKRLPFSKNGSFYSASALLFLLLDILVLAILNISFTYYFLWAFVFALLFSIVRLKILKALFFLASPYWILKSLFELFSLPKLAFCRIVLLSRWTGNLLLAIVLLPFILMMVRLVMLPPRPRRAGRLLRYRITAVLFSLFLVCLLTLFMLYEPYNAENRQPVNAQYTIDLIDSRSFLTLSSPAPLGEITWKDSEDVITIESRARFYTLPLQELPDLLETEVSSTGFLDRRNINLLFSSSAQPYRLSLLLSAPEEFVLYDANFPAQRDPGGREYRILIGANPPLPLPLQLTLPQNMSFELNISLEYLQLPHGYELSGAYKQFSSHYIFQKRLILKT